jgi:hypothetical protein
MVGAQLTVVPDDFSMPLDMGWVYNNDWYENGKNLIARGSDEDNLHDQYVGLRRILVHFIAKVETGTGTGMRAKSRGFYVC